MRLRPFLIVGTGLAIGYVLGARAGRERYEQLRDAARRAWTAPRFVRVRTDSAAFVRENAPLVAERTAVVAKDVAAKTAVTAKDVAAKTAETAKDVAAKTAVTAKDVAAKTAVTAKGVAAKTAEVAKDIADRTVEVAKEVADHTVETATDIADRGKAVVGRAAEAAAAARDGALETDPDDEA